MFRCQVNGNNRNGRTNGETIQWMRADGRPLPSRAVVTGNTMTIRRVESTDEGRYICVASNRYGRNQAEAELSVSGRFNVNGNDTFYPLCLMFCH